MRLPLRRAIAQQQLLLGGQQVPFTLQRSSRRRTIGLRIDGQGLRVTAPPWTSEGEIHAVLQDHAPWVLDKLQRWEQKRAATPALDFSDGAPLLWLGREVRLRHVPAQAAIPRPLAEEDALALQWIPLACDCEAPEAALTAWYTAQALPWFRRRAQHFAHQLGRAPRAIRVANARGRWGSCSRHGVIRLNWRLMQASPAELDYVVAHEVAHLAEMNHGPAFWDTVAALYPDWRTANARLDAQDRLYRRW